MSTSKYLDYDGLIYYHSKIKGLLNTKVNKQEGKGLSTNDFTDAYKTKLDGIAAGAEVNVQSNWNEDDNSSDAYIQNKPNLSTVATSGSYNDLTDKPTIGNATLTIQKNSTTIDTFTANATSNKTINITVPTSAADINALPASTKYGASLSMTIDDTYKAVTNPTGNPKTQGWFERTGTSPNYTYVPTEDTSVQSGKTYYTAPTYVVTTALKDQDGNNLGSSQTIDLPLESVVVSGSYDSQNKMVILTLQDGSTIAFSVADLVSGLQTEITSSNKLASDLVDDTNQTHKFVTSSQITKLNGLQDIKTIGNNLTLSSAGRLDATDTTYSPFTGADGTNAGSNGLVPAPAATDNTKFLKGDGTWASVMSDLPIASATTLGGIKVGTNLTINATTGVLSAVQPTIDTTFTTTGTNAVTAAGTYTWISNNLPTVAITNAEIDTIIAGS